MLVLEWIGIGALILLAAVAALFIRRALVARAGGTIKLTVRLTTIVDGRGWSPGFGRFADDELRWYRMFSFAIRPRRVLNRRRLIIRGRRMPGLRERQTLPPDWEILTCDCDGQLVEIAMAGKTVTGFLSWLEAAPPGIGLPRMLQAGLLRDGYGTPPTADGVGPSPADGYGQARPAGQAYGPPQADGPGAAPAEDRPTADGPQRTH